MFRVSEVEMKCKPRSKVRRPGIQIVHSEPEPGEDSVRALWYIHLELAGQILDLTNW